jgi:hypothetical protein
VCRQKQKYLAQHGVTTNVAGFMMFYNDRHGQLLMRYKPEKAEAVAQAIALLNQKP